MKSFVSRSQARAFRSIINAKAVAMGSTAKLKDPVKDHDNLWIFPGLNHGSKLTIKRK